MRNIQTYIKLLYLFLGLTFVNSLYAQTDSAKLKLLMLRDSLDFNDKKVKFNTSSNEFSPIPYKGGLLFVSNRPQKGTKTSFNRVYWIAASDMLKENINDTARLIANKKNKLNDDFTPPTSNDNDILFNYKKSLKGTIVNEVENKFSKFSTNQAFAYDDSSNLIIYATESEKKIMGKKRWQLWQANLNNGHLTNKKLINFEQKDADYLYPSVSDHGTTLYFSSNIKNSIGGFDIFYVKKQGDLWENKPIALSGVNTESDEIAPWLQSDTLYFSSNRAGGIGGFDIYSIDKKNNQRLLNLGYPINTKNDEISFKKVDNDYFLSTNYNGDFDIAALTYKPINYELSGHLLYETDATIASHQKIIIKDIDEGIIIDSVQSDESAKYKFKAKPNRHYELSTTNMLGKIDYFKVNTLPKQQNFTIVTNLKGPSPKQIKDSIHNLMVMAETRYNDSVALYSVSSKFVVYYNFNKSSLRPSEKIVLDSLLSKLKKMPTSNIIIGAFTDCIGSYKYNFKLSVKRAQSVVAYLKSKGLSKDRIISNGYSKMYQVTPCSTKKGIRSLQNNRRAEVVLSESKNTNWATLEKERGDKFYSVYNSRMDQKPVLVKIPDVVVKKDTVVVAKVIPKVIAPVKKDTVVVAKVIPKVIAPVKKDTVVVAKVIPKVIAPVKKDTVVVAKVIPKVIAPVKKDTVVVAKVIPKVIAPVKKDTVVVAKVIPKVIAPVKKDTVVVAKVIPKVIVPVKKDTVVVAKVIPKVIAPVKKDTVVVAKVIPKVIATVKKDTVVVAKVIPKVIAPVKKDTVVVAKVIPKVIISVKKDTVAQLLKSVTVNALSKTGAPIKKDTTVKAFKPSTPIITTAAVSKKENTKVIAQDSNDEDQITKEEIIKALDSLAKLKREQERIVEYLTKRINKKPILIYVSSDSVDIDIYDNAIHDKDSVSVIYNNRIIVDRQELKVNKPIKFKLKVELNSKMNELVMVAENLGSEPPNTAVLFVTEKNGKRQQVMLSTDMTHNEVIYFIKIGKQK